MSRAPLSRGLLTSLLAGAGALHLAVPRPFAAIVPRALGDPYPWVYLSGVAELALAAGLMVPRSRRVSALGAAALFVAVFPANVVMALDSAGRSTGYQVATWARLPLQAPLVAWALWLAHRERAVRR